MSKRCHAPLEKKNKIIMFSSFLVVFPSFRNFMWRLFVISSCFVALFHLLLVVISSFRYCCVVLFRLFAWRNFVFLPGDISSFCVASFRFVAWRYIVLFRGAVYSSFCMASFRLEAWRYFVVFWRGVISSCCVALLFLFCIFALR